MESLQNTADTFQSVTFHWTFMTQSISVLTIVHRWHLQCIHYRRSLNYTAYLPQDSSDTSSSVLGAEHRWDLPHCNHYRITMIDSRLLTVEHHWSLLQHTWRRSTRPWSLCWSGQPCWLRSQHDLEIHRLTENEVHQNAPPPPLLGTRVAHPSVTLKTPKMWVETFYAEKREVGQER